MSPADIADIALPVFTVLWSAAMLSGIGWEVRKLWRTRKRRLRPGHPVSASGPDMPRAEAAALLGITDREARGLAAAGVLEGLPYDGRPARVTTASVREFLAARNGRAVTP